MENCKIRVSYNNYNWLVTKLIALKITGYGNTPVLRNLRNCYGFYIKDNKTIMIGTEFYFNYLDLPEKTIDEILNYKQMTKLKCVTQPERAKHISVDREYEGELLGEGGNVIERFEDAEFFRCTNNLGNIARYRIDLFEEVEIFITTVEEALEKVNFNLEAYPGGLEVNNHEVIILEEPDGACGVRFADGLLGLYGTIDDTIIDTPNLRLSEDSLHVLRKSLFKNAILCLMEETNYAHIVFHCNDSYREVIYTVMDDLSFTDPERNEAQNPNYGERHLVKTWVLGKSDLIHKGFI